MLLLTKKNAVALSVFIFGFGFGWPSYCSMCHRGIDTCTLWKMLAVSALAEDTTIWWSILYPIRSAPFWSKFGVFFRQVGGIWLLYYPSVKPLDIQKQIESYHVCKKCTNTFWYIA